MLYIIQSILYRKENVTALRFFYELKEVIDIFPSWDNKPKEWFIANPLKDIIALFYSGVSIEALEYLYEKILQKKAVSVVLAGKEKDESPIVIWYKNTPAISEDRYSLTIAIRSPSSFKDRHTFQKILTDMSVLTQWNYSYICLEAE